MGTTHLLSSAAHPTNVCSLEMCHHLKEKEAFQLYEIYCQEALLQQGNNLPNTDFLSFFVSLFFSFFLLMIHILS